MSGGNLELERQGNVRAEAYRELQRIAGPAMDSKKAIEFLDRFFPLGSDTFRNSGTHCRRGHPYTGKFKVQRKAGKVYRVRVCGPCHLEGSRRYKARKRAQAVAA